MRALLHALYDLAWIVAAILGLPWLLWRSLRDKGFGRMVLERAGFGLAPIPRGQAPTRILVHGVSVGEVKGASPLVRALLEHESEFDVVISTTTNTGMEVARQIFPKLKVVRFPADISALVRRFLRCVQADCIVLLELEIWPNFLREAGRAGIPVAVVNGRITTRSYSQYRFFRQTMPQFNRISLYCVQRDQYAARFRALQVEASRVVVTGNIKADGLEVGSVDPGPELRRLLGPANDQKVVVFGSTHEPEERLALEAWAGSGRSYRLVLVPRHPNRANELMRSLSAEFGPLQRMTSLRAGETEPNPDLPVLIDTIGELEAIYALADLVFVGGSLLEHGGQNMLEPAAQGRPVIFGPHIDNFRDEAGLLLAAGACQQIKGAGELQASIEGLIKNEALRAEMSRAGLGAVEAQKGATAQTLAALRERCLAR